MKSDRERQISYDIIYMWNLKYELIYKIETDSQRINLWLLRRRGSRGRKDWEFEISGCKLSYIGCTGFQLAQW